MKRRSGFTLVELLVVIAIIALLVSILMPALGRVRELARRVQCSSQISNVGKAIAMYTNEYKDFFPTVASISDDSWVYCGGQYDTVASLAAGGGSVNRWWDVTWDATDWANTPTIGGCLYLLCRYGDVAPKNFICPSCKTMRAMDEDIRDKMSTTSIVSYKDCMDFSSMESCNYSYQNPLKLPTATSESGLAVYADKNWCCDLGDGTNNWNTNAAAQPYWGTAAAAVPATDPSGFIEAAICTDDDDSSVDFTNRHQNSKNHDTDTQNVLFAGYNVDRCDKPFVGISNDNIYTRWAKVAATPMEKVKGTWGSANMSWAKLNEANEKDSVLGN